MGWVKEPLYCLRLQAALLSLKIAAFQAAELRNKITLPITISSMFGHCLEVNLKPQ